MLTLFKNLPSPATPVGRKRRLRAAPAMLSVIMAAAAVWLSGCGSAPSPTPSPVAPGVPAAPGAAATAPRTPPPPSVARTPKEYRQDAARHLYQLNANRIYKGRLPPMLYAIGTLEVQVDRQGNVVALNWMRAPRHAPEVVAESRLVDVAAGARHRHPDGGHPAWSTTCPGGKAPLAPIR